MKVTINTHYPATTNGVLNDGVKVGGTFYPEGDGTPVSYIDVEPVGKLKFDPDTGAALPNDIATWEGTDCSVRILERPGGNGTRAVLAAWISAKDCQGTVHTAEVPLETGQAFGFVSLTVE